MIVTVKFRRVASSTSSCGPVKPLAPGDQSALTDETAESSTDSFFMTYRRQTGFLCLIALSALVHCLVQCTPTTSAFPSTSTTRTTTGFIWFKWAKSYYDYIPTTSTTTLPSSTTSSPTSFSSSTTCLPTVSSTTSTTSLIYMNGGDQRGQGQSYGGGLPLSEFNKLVPPGWRPGIPGYPIKLFFEQLKLWYRVTDNAEAQLGILVAGRLQGAPQKIALRLRLPRPVAAGGGYDIGDEALIRLSQEQVIDPATNTIVQEYIPSGLQFLCQALRAIYGLQDQDRTTVALDSFYEFKRGHLGLAEFAQEFDHRYESAEDEAGLQMNDTGKTYFFLRGSGLGDKIIEDIKLQMRGDMSRYQEIRTLVLKLARANDKDKETLNMYQDQTDFNYKLNLDETNGNYYGSWHDPTTGEIIEYDYGANTSDDMYHGDYDCVYDGEYSDYDGAGYDDDWHGDDGWQDEVYHGDFPLEEWTWPASAPDSTSVSTAETTLLDVDPSYWKGQTKGKGKGFGAKGKGPSGGSASGIGCATCGSRWHSSLDCPLNDPSKGDQGKGKGGKDYHYENFWKGKGKGKKGGTSKGFGKGWSKGFGKYRPSFGSGKGYGKYSGGYGKSYGKSYGKGKFKGGYGGFRTQYYDFEDEKPSSSTRPPPQSTTEPMIDTAGNPGYNDGYGELDTAPASMPDVRVNSLSFLVGTCSSAFPTDNEDWSSLYRSVRGVKRHGLLIDPGAASGLIGSDTLKEFRDEILLPLGVDIICRPTTQNVSGISGKPEPALSRVTMPIVPGIKSSTFTADVIGKQGSKCPALLPNPSMRAANMGLLTNFFENGDGMLTVHDNGKRLLYRCLLTESGHYILPTDNVKNNNNVDEKATRKASAFYAAVLQDATQQWSDISSVYLAVDKAAVADSVADHVSEKRRRLAQETEFAGRHQALRQAGGAPSDWALPEPPQPAADGGVPMSSPFSPLLTPIDPSKAGLRSPEVPPPGAPKTPMAPPLLTEQMLLENAPSSLNSVVTGSMDDEDQSGNAAARVGYSGRTEKMHRYLAKEFKDTDEQALSYENLCRLQASGRRELIAGCFFELLVLKTNGVIGIEQDKPLSDIRISKASQWAK
ncbi:unnamed protein product [Polarella glacialis]|uniref:Rad21/Rec8-like protein C-terminal eukaryotic domain-containing protein n=1 Tax=Polarella glacialis TaxID=89957 RepID=A0A813JML9_POLGL|nr:unnamed protein product [Polarella glacialis]